MNAPSQHGNRDRIVMRLTVLFVMATCLRVWIGPMPLSPSAHAQIPDSGLQRQQVIEEARRTNVLLTEIKRILLDGTLNVRLSGADNQADTKARPKHRRR